MRSCSANDAPVLNLYAVLEQRMSGYALLFKSVRASAHRKLLTPNSSLLTCPTNYIYHFLTSFAFVNHCNSGDNMV